MAQSMRTWAQNPENKREALMQASLPQLLFRRCHLNCVDSENFSAEAPAEIACIKNCQDKVYQSFDVFINIQKRKEALSSVAIDKSSYIGMEVEHSNDTAGLIPQNSNKLTDVDPVRNFIKTSKNNYQGLRAQAFDRQ